MSFSGLLLLGKDNVKKTNIITKIIDHEVDSLPIVEEVMKDNGDRAYKVVGRITKTTIVRVFAELGNNE